MSRIGIFGLFLLIVLGNCNFHNKEKDEDVTFPSSSLNQEDFNRFKDILQKSFKSKDILSISYSILSFAALKFDMPQNLVKETCIILQNSLENSNESNLKAEILFATTLAITKLPACKLASIKPAIKKSLENLLEVGTTSKEIFYVTEIFNANGISIDPTVYLKKAIKDDESPISLGYALWILANNYNYASNLNIWDRINGIQAQADEFDFKHLQFEGGLYVTAPVINGIFRLAEAANKKPPLTSDVVIKFGNYLVSRKTVTSPRGIWLFSTSLDILSSNKFLAPVYVGIISSELNRPSDESNLIFIAQASDLFGRPLDISLQLSEIVKVKDEKHVEGIDNILATQSSSSKIMYYFEMQTKDLEMGFYEASIKVSSKEKHLITQEISLEFKVTGKLGMVKIRVGIFDSDQQSRNKWTELEKGDKLPNILEVDANQKLIIHFSTSESLHQVFVLLKHKDSKREVAFVASQGENKNNYKLELDLTTNAKDLNYKSGVYDIFIYLGDFLLEDSLEWQVGQANLNVATGKSIESNPLYDITYGLKPTIEHVFREPEKRPSKFLSDIFTFLSLLPLILLLICLLKVGANIKNFPLNLNAFGFHIGLLGIFGIYFGFWLKLSMFDCLKYMIAPCVVTFLSGHRLLSEISQRKNLVN